MTLALLAAVALIAILALTYLLIYNNWRQQSLISELLDRIMQLQSLPPVSSPTTTDESLPPREQRRRPEQDRVRFAVR